MKSRHGRQRPSFVPNGLSSLSIPFPSVKTLGYYLQDPGSGRDSALRCSRNRQLPDGVPTRIAHRSCGALHSFFSPQINTDEHRSNPNAVLVSINLWPAVSTYGPKTRDEASFDQRPRGKRSRNHEHRLNADISLSDLICVYPCQSVAEEPAVTSALRTKVDGVTISALSNESGQAVRLSRWQAA
jgi:hypothetical protein